MIKYLTSIGYSRRSLEHVLSEFGTPTSAVLLADHLVDLLVRLQQYKQFGRF